MLWAVVRFELRYHLRRTSTYVFMFLLAFLPFMLFSLGEGTERQLLDSPLRVAGLFAELSLPGMLIAAALAGMAIVRDFEEDAYQLFFTTPLRRGAYLGGRLIGSLLVLVLIFGAVPLGGWLGTQMPWADHAHLGSTGIWPFVQGYLLPVTTVVAAATVFFAVGALSRSVIVVYLQGVAFVAIYLMVSRLAADNLNSFWPALFDPFGWATLEEATKYWSLIETNTRYLSPAGILLWNRLIWFGVALTAAAVTFRFFPLTAEGLSARKVHRRATSPPDNREAIPALTVPPVSREFNWAAVLTQIWSLTRVRVAFVTRDLVFVALCLGVAAIYISDSWVAPQVGNTTVLPVTALMASRVDIELILIITLVYAGELVWRERSIRFDQIADSTPVPGWAVLISQFAALATLQVMLLCGMTAISVAGQAWLGYFQFEPAVYAKLVFGLTLSQLLLYSGLALSVHSLIGNKFLAHALVIGIVLGPNLLLAQAAQRWSWTIPTELYIFATRPRGPYSDMNQYGPYLEGALWYTAYWLAWTCVAVTAALRLARRGTEGAWRARWRAHDWGWSAWTAAGLGVLAVVGIGTWNYRQQRTLARYVPPDSLEGWSVRYEQQYKRFERLPQPKIVDVQMTVHLFPSEGRMSASGTYVVQNTTDAPMPAVHIVDGDPARPWVRSSVSLSRPGRDLVHDEVLHYRIHQLDDPLEPGERMELRFTTERERPPFDDSDELVRNGTFFDRGWFPSIGYARSAELTGEADRRDQGLPPREDLPPPDDAWGRSRSLFVSDADWISFRATVSTEADQIAVAPGYLQREWTEGGRRYFAYDMGPTRMHNFYSFVSARYAVARDTWNDVDIQVFHDPKHAYNVGRMIEASKVGLEYFTKHFGPYQFRQFRVLEFPRYRPFAQSFPNTVPFSESIGFIERMPGEGDLDLSLYVTLHELAHQWWGHQVVGGFAEGSNILSEMMAEYSALVATEHVIGPDRIRLYLRHALDDYLRGRRQETRGEQTLARVTRQGYVWYNKGSLAMYAMRDALGEDVLNAYLRDFIHRHRLQEPPYTTVDEFLSGLRAVTPADRQYLIDDLFYAITLHDNRALNATWRPTPDGRFAVTLTVFARKTRADDMGNEQDQPLDDLIDIGVFAGSGASERALFFEKRRVVGGETTFEVVVDEQPTRAGIDPYSKLIDRVPGDNVVAVTTG
jgi:ABC-2 type transport system permease protein